MIQPLTPRPSPAAAVEAFVDRFATRHRRRQVATSLLKTLAIGLLLLLPLTSLAALPWGRTVSWRVFTALLTWPILVLIGIAFVRPALRRRPTMRSARDIEKRFPQLEERLSTTLTREPAGPLAASPSLRAHVARAAHAELLRLPPDDLVPSRPSLRWLLAALALGITWATILSFPPSRRPLTIGLYRLWQPWQSRLPDSLADLTARPGNVTLLEGETLSITATTSADRVTLAIESENAERTTRLMQRVSPAHWRLDLNDVRESFRYRILTDRDDTSWFRAAVTPRPAVESLTIRYDFPPYTKLPPKTVTALDAPVDALTNTRVTFTLRATQSLDLRQSRLILTPSSSQPLSPVDHETQYQTTFTLDRDNTFFFDLVNPTGVHSRPAPPRRITARADQLPSIVLQFPGDDITARPDDTIALQFLASDDFAVTTIEALVRLDNSAAQSLPVPFDPADSKHISGPEFPLSLATLLSSAQPDVAHQIEIQLRATDNRLPNPQSTASALRLIHIDPLQSRSYQGQLDQTLARTLQDVIANTIKELDLARPRLLQSKTRDGSEPLGDWQRRELHAAAHDLPATATRLARTAAQPYGPTFIPVARALAQVADGPLRDAAEQSARADLNADDWQPRNDAIAQSVAAIKQSRDALQELLDSGRIEQRRARAEAARDLGAAEQLQRAALDAIRRNDLAKAAGLQSRAAQRLRQAMEQSTALRDEASQRLAEQLQNLDNALHDLAGKVPLPPDQSARLKELADLSTQAATALRLAASAMNLALATPASSTPGSPGSGATGAIESPVPAGPGRTAVTGPLPASIRDLGISPDQWLKLSPAAQRDVLSTSQQLGPPAYRPLIQDYYVKVSQMPK